MRITEIRTHDIRFPTSRDRDGSDAMHPDPDYSAAYVMLQTDGALVGHGLAFTLGRGTELVVGACQSLAPLLQGLDLAEFAAAPAAIYRRLANESQLRWLGPEKGVIQLAVAALTNALWDLWAKEQNKPLWRLLADLSPKQFVAATEFRYLTDVITPEQAEEMLETLVPLRPELTSTLLSEGYPAYTTSAGWLGYDDAKVRRLSEEAVAAGFRHIKLKVGRDLGADLRRCQIVREILGDDGFLMVDANQVWDVNEAIVWMEQLAAFKPLWIEEPTCPDDILGHAAIAASMRPLGIKVATGEHAQNRVTFKQLFQADAIGYCQLDACRLGGVSEVLAVLLLAAKFEVPVCPHAGGVGLCEYVQHLAMADFLCVSGVKEGRVIEFVDHLHEHFIDPVRVVNGRYLVPTRPGYSIEMRPEALAEFAYPHGSAWRTRS